MWFSPLKGAHLTLGQLDKTLPVDVNYAPTSGTYNGVKLNKKIERGSFVFIHVGTTVTDAPRFQLYTSAESAKPNAVPYIALMGVNDWQAGMAGNVGQAENAQGIATGTHVSETSGSGVTASNNVAFLGATATEGAQSFRGPRITAISIIQPAEYQTTAFETKDSSNNAYTYYVGCPLTVSDNGKLCPFTNGKNIVGYVTAIPKTRWINNLGDDDASARITGGNAQVIEFSTAWIPCAAVATTDSDAGLTKNVDKLSVGAPKVQAAAPAAPAAPAAVAPKANTPAK